jgi:hypothetical protein
MLKRLLARFLPKHAGQDTQADTVFVPIRDAQGRVTGKMDQLTAAYLQSTAPAPSQRTLDAMLGQVSRIRVLDDGMSAGKPLGSTVLLDSSDSEGIAALRPCLTISEDPDTFGHCMCLGDNAIECYADQELLATIGLHHGISIRWDVWKDDGQLQDGQALLNWLADRGVTAPLEAYRAAQQRATERQGAAQRWIEAIPACLRPHWPEMQGFNVDIEVLRQALASVYPDHVTRALALFAWFGSGAGPWSGFPMYERVAEELLLDVPTAELVAALAEHQLTATQLGGAARYFAGWSFYKQKPNELQQLPAEIKRRLLAHSRTSSDEDVIQRAERAFR